MRPQAIIVDRDGTLAAIERQFVTNGNNDWQSFNNAIRFDGIVPTVVERLKIEQAANPDVVTLMTTGRSEEFRGAMMDWIAKYDLPIDFLLMRRFRDQRADHVVKREIYVNLIEPHFDVYLVIDDRPSVCAMWRDLGLNVVQVEQPEDAILFPGFS